MERLETLKHDRLYMAAHNDEPIHALTQRNWHNTSRWSAPPLTTTCAPLTTTVTVTIDNPHSPHPPYPTSCGPTEHTKTITIATCPASTTTTGAGGGTTCPMLGTTTITETITTTDTTTSISVSTSISISISVSISVSVSTSIITQTDTTTATTTVTAVPTPGPFTIIARNSANVPENQPAYLADAGSQGNARVYQVQFSDKRPPALFTIDACSGRLIDVAQGRIAVSNLAPFVFDRPFIFMLLQSQIDDLAARGFPVDICRCSRAAVDTTSELSCNCGNGEADFLESAGPSPLAWAIRLNAATESFTPFAVPV